MPTPYDFSSSLLIDGFDTVVAYLERKPNLPLASAGDQRTGQLLST
ncbi:hypothetical protein [Spirosoma radiotolerans]|nr:hypothetical protein [Spirosoma radiotolerans]